MLIPVTQANNNEEVYIQTTNIRYISRKRSITTIYLINEGYLEVLEVPLEISNREILLMRNATGG